MCGKEETVKLLLDKGMISTSSSSSLICSLLHSPSFSSLLPFLLPFFLLLLLLFLPSLLLILAGIDISLKDSNGKTILAILTEIPATRARKIHSLISGYVEKTHVPKNRYMKPRSYRLLAIPVCDSNNDVIMGETGTEEELPRLKYREGMLPYEHPIMF